MAVLTTDAEIDEAIAAGAADDRPRTVKVSFDERLNVLIIKLSDGTRCLIPRENVQGLQSATPEQLNNVEIFGPGLHWKDLDVDFTVAGLMRGIYGSAKWMAAIGKVGGKAKSERKKEASKTNGRKGGRPRRLEKPASKSEGREQSRAHAAKTL
jgi:hypothetical protein